MTTKNFDYAGQAPGVDELAEGLEVVMRIGLIPRRLVEAAESQPALAQLLSLDLLGSSDASMLVRAGRLGDVLAIVLDRLGEGRLSRAADALLSVSGKYRGQSYEQRYNTAAAEWEPDYRDNRHFGRPRKDIIRDVAAEMARYQEEQHAVGHADEPHQAPTRVSRTRLYAAIGLSAYP